MKGRYLSPVAILMVVLRESVVAGPARAAPCVTSTPALDHMGEATVVIAGIGEEGAELPVKVADDNNELAAGFQHICPEAIGDTAVLFLFGARTQAPFHMRNVHASLDLAFIDARGVVVDVQSMKPYVESVVFVRQPPLYRSTTPFASALETAADGMAKLGVKVGSRVALK